MCVCVFPLFNCIEFVGLVLFTVKDMLRYVCLLHFPFKSLTREITIEFQQVFLEKSKFPVYCVVFGVGE